MKKSEEIIKLIKKDIEDNLEKYVTLKKEKVIEFLLSFTLEELFDDFKIKNQLLEKKTKTIKKKELFTDIFNNECTFSEITRDHIWPLSKNGLNNKENIMYICELSNTKKADLTEGTINGVKWKVSKNKPKGTKGKLAPTHWKGVLAIKQSDKKTFKTIKIVEEQKYYDDFKNKQQKLRMI